MAKQRGLIVKHGKLYFQARIPTDLVQHYPKPIITEKLPTQDRTEAKVLVCKRLVELDEEFTRIRTTGSKYKTSLSTSEADHLIALAIHTRMTADQEIRSDGVDDSTWESLGTIIDEADDTEKKAIARGQLTPHAKAVVDDWLQGHGYNLEEDSQAYRAFALQFIKAQSVATKGIKQRHSGEHVDTPPAPIKQAPEALPVATESTSPKLSKTIEYFLEHEDQDKPMYTKYTAVLSMFLEWVGDKPVSDLKQLDIEDYLRGICRLPPRWSDVCRQRKITAKELAKEDHPVVMARKTYEDTYQAALRPFLKAAQRTFGDSGFPYRLTTEGVKYSGDRNEADNKQRAMKPEEIKRLFEGKEYQEFARDRTQAYKYWFPLVGLYTGARVNEVCQINPQVDVIQDQESGIWYFNMTDETATAEGVKKSIKTKESKRKVPIHSELIRLGFLDYVDRIKKTNALLLFPEFPPSRGRASGFAAKWFRVLLDEIGLRDETQGLRLVGYHTFRHTIENYALNNGGFNVDKIVGHVDPNESAVKRGYQGEQSLLNKKEILDKVRFDVKPPKVTG